MAAQSFFVLTPGPKWEGKSCRWTVNARFLIWPRTAEHAILPPGHPGPSANRHCELVFVPATEQPLFLSRDQGAANARFFQRPAALDSGNKSCNDGRLHLQTSGPFEILRALRPGVPVAAAHARPAPKPPQAEEERACPANVCSAGKSADFVGLLRKCPDSPRSSPTV